MGAPPGPVRVTRPSNGNPHLSGVILPSAVRIYGSAPLAPAAFMPPPLPVAVRQEKSASGSCRSTSGLDEATDGCTSRRSNAHGTINPEEREVLYPWHPWAKCLVRIHETIAKVDSIVLRCS